MQAQKHSSDIWSAKQRLIPYFETSIGDIK